MRRVEFLSALREYEEKKESLREAEERMERARSLAGQFTQYDGTGFVHIPLFKSSEQFIVDSISQLKKAHYAFEDLFV